ncbi:stealth family protein [Yoonia sp. SS1-5]|uniref:Stealth family protein n=1 Tax=Yoonia rhodophyticola TaxID=3137370 RepID=A0AAN0MLA3_9RHOB
MVDAVIAWVDGSDPEHIRKREKYKSTQHTQRTDAYAATRFSNNGELRYCINLIRKNAPWIREIFLITDSQCPDWLDAARRTELGVTIVDHKVIFRGHEEVLPTFNSLALETVLHRIPGLGEKFIYFNDDFFIVKPVLQKDYFDGSIPLIRGFYYSNNKFFRELNRLFGPKKFKMRGMVGTRFRQEDGVPLPHKVKICHTPHPIIKQDYANLMEDCDRVARNTKYRFRDAAQFGPVPFYVSTAFSAGRAKIVRRDDLYLDPADREDIDQSDIRAQLSKKRIRHMCVQSLEEFADGSRAGIYDILDELVASDVTP